VQPETQVLKATPAPKVTLALRGFKVLRDQQVLLVFRAFRALLVQRERLVLLEIPEKLGHKVTLGLKEFRV
jgi:hypothetical protein